MPDDHGFAAEETPGALRRDQAVDLVTDQVAAARIHDLHFALRDAAPHGTGTPLAFNTHRLCLDPPLCQAQAQTAYQHPVRSLLDGALHLGGIWVRWAQHGQDGHRLQRVAHRIVDWAEHDGRLHRAMDAPRAQRLLAFGNRAVSFVDNR